AKGKGRKSVTRRPMPLPPSLIARLKAAAGDRPPTAPLLRRADGEAWQPIRSHPSPPFPPTLAAPRPPQGVPYAPRHRPHRPCPPGGVVAAANGRHARHHPQNAVQALRPLHRRPFDRTDPPGAVGPRPRARRQSGAAGVEAAMSKRRLPLDSLDWTPFDVLHPL